MTPELPPTLPEELAPLAFVVGSWASDDGFAEHWTAVGDVVYGVALDGWGFEVLKIDRVDDVIRYVAQPGGAPPTPFALVSQRGARAVFSNPAHDDPKEIAYRRRGADALTARVSGSTVLRLSMTATPPRPATGILEADRSRDPRRRPITSGLAPAGDLAFTVGTLDGENAVAGAYATVWRRAGEGGWTVVFDALDPLDALD